MSSSFIFFLCYNKSIMKHIFEQKVYYADTDSYGVVWHGSYLRWLEAGRVELCENLGLNLIDLKANDIAIPVVNMNVRYKSSAKLNDNVVIETVIKKVTPLSVTFYQTVTNKQTGALYIQAEFDTVAINNDGKLYRRLPEVLVKALEGAVCKD